MTSVYLEIIIELASSTVETINNKFDSTLIATQLVLLHITRHLSNAYNTPTNICESPFIKLKMNMLPN